MRSETQGTDPAILLPKPLGGTHSDCSALVGLNCLKGAPMKLLSELILITLVLTGCGGGGGGGTGATSTDQTVTASKNFIDTGISADMCYGANSDTLMECTSKDATSLNSKQDGMVGLDVSKPDNRDGRLGFSYSLVSNLIGGNYDKTECVKDNITGLMWEGKPDSGTRGSPAHDLNKTYTNYQIGYGYGDVDINGNSTGKQATITQVNDPSNAQGYVNAVNATGLCGYKDWRLPTRTELLSLVN